MDDKKFYFTSLIISIILYLLLIIIVLYYLKANKVIQYDVANKETTIELNLVSFSDETIPKDIAQTKIKKPINDEKTSIVKQSTSRSITKTSTMKSLFANTKIEAANISKDNILNIRSSLINSRFKSKFEKEKKIDNITNSTNLHNIKKINKNKVSLKSNKNYDEYYATIKKILSSRFRPKLTTEEPSSKVLVTINSNGVFSYRIDKYSNNEIFDNYLIDFLNSQILIKFPPNKRNVNEFKIRFAQEM
jgi:hypothetical protein